MAQGGLLAPGDPVVFCASGVGHLATAIDVIRSASLVPLAYEGVGLNVRESSLDRELRDDFYRAKYRVIFLESRAKDAASDNWALPEIKHVPRDRLLIYASADIPAQEIKKLALPVDAVYVRDEAEFENDFREKLASALRGS